MNEQEIELMFSCLLHSVFKIKAVKDTPNDSEVATFVAKKIGEGVLLDKQKLFR
jgi:hypothetical protein